MSIVVRPDGVYEAAELRAACRTGAGLPAPGRSGLPRQQMQRRALRVRQGRDGAGCTFAQGEGAALPPGDGPAFQGDAYEGFRVVSYKFGDVQLKEQIVTQNVPLAIQPLYDWSGAPPQAGA
ncbi:hypothetical protein LP419_07870 [Massilia sp. H-1]|nr:hypothetical protein LP419_07870 [Massilia sp. H-1]